MNSFFEIFELQKVPKNGDRVEWQRTKKFSELWKEDDFRKFQQMMKCKETSEKYIKSRERKMKEHEENVKKLEEEIFELDEESRSPGSLGEAVYFRKKDAKEEIILAESTKMISCENQVEENQKKIRTQESRMYCLLTNTEWIDVAERLKMIRKKSSKRRRSSIARNSMPVGSESPELYTRTVKYVPKQ